MEKMRREGIALTAFTERGRELASKLAEADPERGEEYLKILATHTQIIL